MAKHSRFDDSETKLQYIKTMYIQSQSADPAPPLGTILGNLGVNTVKFCESFNTYTKKLPSYFTLRVHVSIYKNRSFTFSVDFPATGHLLDLLKFEKIFKVKVHDRMHEQSFECIYVYQLLKIALFKHPYLPLEESFSMIVSGAKSKGLRIIK